MIGLLVIFVVGSLVAEIGGESLSVPARWRFVSRVAALLLVLLAVLLVAVRLF